MQGRLLRAGEVQSIKIHKNHICRYLLEDLQSTSDLMRILLRAHSRYEMIILEVVVGVCDGSPQGLDSDPASATLKKCIQAV